MQEIKMRQDERTMRPNVNFALSMNLCGCGKYFGCGNSSWHWPLNEYMDYKGLPCLSERVSEWKKRWRDLPINFGRTSDTRQMCRIPNNALNFIQSTPNIGFASLFVHTNLIADSSTSLQRPAPVWHSGKKVLPFRTVFHDTGNWRRRRGTETPRSFEYMRLGAWRLFGWLFFILYCK